ncbi:MAG TPA: HAD-IIB family hydrolase, partial [Burkholderiales bacterium]|nr:HAD-IIB family hydrolase [Burkholderiales bacterium]
MRFVALATDYDGTLARDGIVPSEAVAALERLAATGRKLILVTGRELDQLLEIFPQIDRFDSVVAENGALLYTPGNGRRQALADPPPPEFIAALRSRGVPVIWIVHANTTQNGRTDWEVFFANVVRSAEVRKRMAESLAPEKQAVWKDLEVKPGDVTLVKNRYSAFAHGASTVERVLRNLGVDTVLVAGTKTNV